MKKANGKNLALDEGACIFGAGILSNHVQALKEEISGIQAGSKDIEFVHRARVASRRLRSAFPLFSSCLPQKKAASWQKNIRQVTQALGEARDTDVQIEHLEKFLKKVPERTYRPGILRLTLRLRQHRRKIQPAVEKAVEKLSSEGILDQMIERFSKLAARSSQVYMYTPTLYLHSIQSINSRLDEFLAYEPYITQPDKVTELHEMRIRAKWLRYTIENFSTLYSDELKSSLQVIRKAQDLLGEIHDCDVWNEYLPLFTEQERQRVLDYFDHTRFFHRLVAGIEYFHQNCIQERRELYEEFVANWQKWLEQDVWTNLRRSIQVPFPDPASIYPPPAPMHELPGEDPI